MLNVIGLALSFLTVLNASPIQKRDTSTDIEVLNYALTLEHLESTLYKQVLAQYTDVDFVNAGYPDPFYATLQQVSAEEATHVEFLTSAVQAAGGQAVDACTYNFPYTSPGTFLSLIATIEGVGTSAYLGVLQNVSMEYVTPAASIDLVEAMHTAFERAALQLSPLPGAFVTPLSLKQGFTIASQFIVSCPAGNPSLSVTAYPALAFTGTTQAQSGTSAMFSTKAILPSGAMYIAWTSGLMTQYEPVIMTDGMITAAVPATMLDGQVYATLTTSATEDTFEAVVAGPAPVEVALPNAMIVNV